MRRFLLAAVMLGAAAGAQAADMPDFPILRGAFTEAPPPATVYWQGYYTAGRGDMARRMRILDASHRQRL